MPDNDRFLADPEAFCTPAPAGQGRILIIKEEQTVRLKPAHPTGYRSVLRGDRVSYCQIAQDVDISQQGQSVRLGGGGRAYAAVVRNGPPDIRDFGDQTSLWFPVFYLPWQAQATYRTTLKQPAGFRVQVRVFVTSTVDGCSVIVEGDPQAPTVYHLNDAGGGGNPPAPNLALQQAYWTPKAATMEGRFQAARSPKSIRNAPAPAPGAPNPFPAAKAVHAMDYMDVTEAQKATVDTAVHHWGHKADVKRIVPDAVRIQYQNSLYKPYGTVFGWKQNQTWRFFYQRRSVIFYMYRATNSEGAASTIAIPEQLGFHLDEFWPAGSGVAVGKAVVP